MKIIYLFSNFSYAYFEELWQLDIMFFFYRTKYKHPENWASISEVLRARTLLISIGCGICLGLKDYGLRSTDAIFSSISWPSIWKFSILCYINHCVKYRNCTWFPGVENLRKRTVSGESRANLPKLCGKCAFPQNFHTTKLGENTVFHVVNQTQNQISQYFDKKCRSDQVIFFQLRINLSGMIFLLYILTFFNILLYGCYI